METYNFPTAYKGDTFSGVIFTVEVNATPMDLTNTTIACEFRRGGKSGPLELRITSSDGITIVDAVNGIFQIDPLIIDFNAGQYVYDIEFNTLGVIKTYIQGNLSVTQDITETI